MEERTSLFNEDPQSLKAHDKTILDLYKGTNSADQRIKDQEDKKTSGKSVERIINEADTPFQFCFGMDKLMKAAVTVAGLHSPWDLSRLCLMIAEQQYLLKQQGLDISTEEISRAIVQKSFSLLSIPIEVPQTFTTNGYTDDALLNIGDPFLKINNTLDSARVTTIDYEWGTTHDNKITTRKTAVNALIGSAQEALSLIDNVENNIPIGIREQLRDLLEELEDLASEYVTTVDPDSIFQKIQSIVKSIRHLTYSISKEMQTEKPNSPLRDRRFSKVMYHGLLGKYRNQGVDEDTATNLANNEFDFSRATGEILSSIFYATKAESVIAAQRLFESSVAPSLLWQHIEDIMDAHLQTLELSHQGNSELLSHLAQWEMFLRGRQDKIWNPDTDAGTAVDLVIEFYMKYGFNGLKHSNPDLASLLENSIQEAMHRLNPPINTADHAKAYTMMFPHTDALPVNQYDRILASWSFSAHMIQKMDSDYMAENMWPELDRLMSNRSVAVIFPIDKYAGRNPDGTFNLASDRLNESFKIYTSKNGTKLQYFFHESDDEPHEATVLVLYKGYSRSEVQW